jgi:hypothetical protein
MKVQANKLFSCISWKNIYQLKAILQRRVRERLYNLLTLALEMFSQGNPRAAAIRKRFSRV